MKKNVSQRKTTNWSFLFYENYPSTRPWIQSIFNMVWWQSVTSIWNFVRLQPWSVRGESVEVPGSALRAHVMPLWRPGGASGLLEGSLGHCWNQHQKLHKIQMLDDSTVMVKPTEYQPFHDIINVDRKSLIEKVMLKAMKYEKCHESVNVEH